MGGLLTRAVRPIAMKLDKPIDAATPLRTFALNSALSPRLFAHGNSNTHSK